MRIKSPDATLSIDDSIMDADEMSEKELIRSAQSGNNEDFEKITHLFERRIFLYLYGLVRHREEAEDLAVEVFLRLYSHLFDIDPERGVTSWLFTVATNVARDWFRKKKRRSEFLFEEAGDIEHETIGAEDTYTLKETRETIDGALEHIRPEYKIVLTLFFYEGLTYEEIAVIMNIPLNTVKTYLFRAKKALKIELLGSGYTI